MQDYFFLKSYFNLTRGAVENTTFLQQQDIELSDQQEFYDNRRLNGANTSHRHALYALLGLKFIH